MPVSTSEKIVSSQVEDNIRSYSFKRHSSPNEDPKSCLTLVVQLVWSLQRSWEGLATMPTSVYDTPLSEFLHEEFLLNWGSCSKLTSGRAASLMRCFPSFIRAILPQSNWSSQFLMFWFQTLLHFLPVWFVSRSRGRFHRINYSRIPSALSMLKIFQILAMRWGFAILRQDLVMLFSATLLCISFLIMSFSGSQPRICFGFS